jgi:serine/threonine protein kinase
VACERFFIKVLSIREARTMLETTIGCFVLADRIGSGGFGTVYKATHVTSGSEIAVKFEASPGAGTVEIEAAVYEILAGGIGIPKLHQQGVHDAQCFIAIDLLGPSLTKVFKVLDFSIGTISIVAEKMISCLEYVHSKGIVHCDVKPSNILIGREPGTIYLCDFGLAACWWHKESFSEFEFRGSPNWASLRAHERECSVPSDDLECLGYSLAHFVLGELPWREQAKYATSEDDHWDLRKVKTKFIRKAHESIDLPRQLVTYLQYFRRMLHNPDYDYLRVLWSLTGFEGEEFDWTLEWDESGIDFDASSITSEWMPSEWYEESEKWYADGHDSVDSYQR